MGWTACNTITVKRDFEKRVIVVEWIDDVTGCERKEFPFGLKREAMEFATTKFNSLEM